MATTTHTAEAPLTEARIAGWRERIRQTTLANYQFEMGFALWRTGNPDAAVAALGRALDIQPDLATADPLLARIEEELGHVDAARQRMKGVLARNPLLWSRGCVGLAMCHHREKDFEQAEAWLAVGRAVTPDDGLLRACAGLIHAKLGRWSQACTEFDAVTAVDGVELDSLAGDIVDTLEITARHQFLDWTPPQPDKTVFALAAARAILRLDPRVTTLQDPIIRGLIRLGRSAEALREMDGLSNEWMAEKGNRILVGIVLLSLGKHERAAEVFAECAALDPSWSLPLTYLGLLSLAKGDVPRALDLLQTARLKNPQDDFAISSYGLGVHAAGRLAEAIQVHKAALDILPFSTWARINLGLALEAAGDTSGGWDAYRTALESGALFCHTALNLRPFGVEELKERFAALGFPYKAV